MESKLIQTTNGWDDLPRMKEVIKEAITRSQVVITTGGIGPNRRRSHPRKPLQKFFKDL